MAPVRSSDLNEAKHVSRADGRPAQEEGKVQGLVLPPVGHALKGLFSMTDTASTPGQAAGAQTVSSRLAKQLFKLTHHSAAALGMGVVVGGA